MAGRHGAVRWAWARGHRWMSWAGLIGVLSCLVAGVALGIAGGDSGGGSSGGSGGRVVVSTSVVSAPGQTVISFITPESGVIVPETTVVGSGSGGIRTVIVGPSAGVGVGVGARVTVTAHATVTATTQVDVGATATVTQTVPLIVITVTVPAGGANAGGAP